MPLIKLNLKPLLKTTVILGYIGFYVSWHADDAKHDRSEFFQYITAKNGHLLLRGGTYCQGKGCLSGDGLAVC